MFKKTNGDALMKYWNDQLTAAFGSGAPRINLSGDPSIIGIPKVEKAIKTGDCVVVDKPNNTMWIEAGKSYEVIVGQEINDPNVVVIRTKQGVGGFDVRKHDNNSVSDYENFRIVKTAPYDKDSTFTLKKKKCECGAKHTSEPDCHPVWCDLYKEME